MIRKKNKFSRPHKLYDKIRIGQENKLVEMYGLKNKKEIWKSEAKVKYFRSRAKILINASQEEQKNFFEKLNSIGLIVTNIADVLALGKEDILKRRLSTIVWKKGLSKTARHARQLITHRNILVEGRSIDVPSYLVPVDLEKEIVVKQKKKIQPKEIKNE
ncbi:30S ribosomal protein S4 [Candidatus Pacearchaeota archaeon]|nr:30S ribosomal protein S4 [Candidatus Pacearchaeota archaeon]